MTALRGIVCWPLSPTEAVFLEDGVVAPDLPAPRPATSDDPPPVDGVIVPGFADWHFHWVQLGIAGRGSEALLQWLERTTWPEETRFADPAVCRHEAPRAAATLHRAGTRAGAAYGSPHAASAAAFLDASPCSFLCGPAVMTTGGPSALRHDLAPALREIGALADRFGDRVVVSPRFALSCDDFTLASLGDLARRRGLPVQTHLAETGDEVAAVGRAFPTARDYLDVYARAGLVGPRTLLGHVIHVSDDELRRIAASEAIVVHCPTSNLALGSGRMELERLRAHGVRWTLGSDVGAGPDPSMLDVLGAGLTVHAGFADVSATELFHRATLGAAALFAGGSERRLARVGDRPEPIVLPRPAGLGRGETRPEAWFRALIEA